MRIHQTAAFMFALLLLFLTQPVNAQQTPVQADSPNSQESQESASRPRKRIFQLTRLDYAAGMMGRAYPPGAMFYGTLGHSWRLWGHDPVPSLPRIGPGPSEIDGSPLWHYGYVRALLNVQTAFVMNRVTAELEVFPVSILGFAVGQGVHQTPAMSQQFDCKLDSACKGVLDRTSIRAQALVGYQKFFGLLVARKEWIRQNASAKPFTDEGLGIRGAPGRDQFVSMNGAFGYQLDSKWVTGIQFMKARSVILSEDSLTSLFFVTRFSGVTSYTVAAGTFRSDHVKLSPTVAFQIHINKARAISLF
ncbi:MAG: hypothetical protein JNL01_11810 [Bdellovibrionales bacterium]|nr:hypothetical protein [Bdellovibrionales bacterium]